MIVVSGTVVSIDKDFTEPGYVTLRRSGLMGVHAELSDAGIRGGASFTKGQNVHLVCRGAERILTVTTLNDCESLDDYLNGLTPSIKAKIAQFLKDGKALGNVHPEPIVAMYVAGLHLPRGSQCLNGKLDACLPEMAVLAKDKTQAQSIHDETAKMMASLNFK